MNSNGRQHTHHYALPSVIEKQGAALGIEDMKKREQEQAATKRRKAEEKERLSAKLRKAAKKRSRKSARQRIQKRVFEINRAAMEAVKAEHEREELNNRIEDHVRAYDLDRGDLVSNATRFYLTVPFLIAVIIVDFVFLGQASALLLSIAVIYHPALVTAFKILIPICIVTAEVASLRMQWTPKERGTKPIPKGHEISGIAYAIPASVAIFAGVTFLANAGITSLSQITFLEGSVFMGVLAFGFTLHYFVLALGHNFYEGVALFALARKRRTYEKAARRVMERRTEGVYNSYRRLDVDIRKYNEGGEDTIAVPYQQFSNEALEIINDLSPYPVFEGSEPWNG